MPEGVSGLELSSKLIDVRENGWSPSHLILPAIVLDRQLLKLFKLSHLVIELLDHVWHARLVIEELREKALFHQLYDFVVELWDLEIEIFLMLLRVSFHTLFHFGKLLL